MDTVDRPRQVIVSDMTAFKFWYYYFEVTFYFDVFTKEILSWKIAERRGHRGQYIEGLKDVVELLKGTTEPTVIHTDQGSVYASKAYNELIQETNIIRSMSRAGKPTDNPVNESLNGWIKEELYMDFKIDQCSNKEEFNKNYVIFQVEGSDEANAAVYVYDKQDMEYEVQKRQFGYAYPNKEYTSVTIGSNTFDAIESNTGITYLVANTSTGNAMYVMVWNCSVADATPLIETIVIK